MSDYEFEDEDLNLDDFDDMFDDDFDGMDVDEDSRSPVEAFKDGAIDSLKDVNNASAMAKILATNALPDGYSLAASRVSNSVNFGKDLYDEARKSLKEPIDSIRKDLAKAIEGHEEKSVFGFNLGEIKDKLAPKEEAKSNVTSLSGDELAIQSTLNSIFERTENLESNQIAQAESTRAAAADSSTINELRRLTSFQDTIQIDWMRKSLELQQRGYFVDREMLAVMKAMATDQKSGMESLVKNTSLPDIVKDSLTEAYGQQIQERLFGKTIDSASEYFSGFGSRLQENIKTRVMGGVENFKELLEAGSEITDALGMAGDDIRGEELGGSLFASMGGEFLSAHVGDRIAKFVRRYPKIAEYGRDLAFYAENYPTELLDAVDSWNGEFFSDKAIERFPFLGRFQSQFLADELRGIIPRMQELRVGINQNLRGQGATELQQFDEITRRSIIEIIPGYLSRMLEQLTIANYGPDAERIVYDINSESFTSEKEAASNALNAINNTSALNRVQNQREVHKLLNKGRFMDEGFTDELIDYLKDARSRGIELTEEGIVDDLDNQDNIDTDRVVSLFRRSGRTDGALDNALRRIATNEDADLKKELLVKDTWRRITGGNALSPDAQLALEEWITDHAITGVRPKKETLMEDLAKKGVDKKFINEIGEGLAGSKLFSREKDSLLARLGREVGDTIAGYQKSINRFYAAGQKDLLDRMGLTSFTGRGENIIDQSITRGYDLEANMRNDRPELNRMNPGSNYAGVTGPSSEASPYDFWNAFSIARNNEAGVPVHVMSGLEERAREDEQPVGPDPMLETVNNLHQMVERGFITQAELLDLIYKKDLEVNIQEQPGFFRSLISTGAGLTSSGLDLISAYTRGVFGMGNALIGGAGNIVGNTIGAAGNVLGSTLGIFSRSGKRDIFVAGNPQPVITVADLKAGIYVDENTGNPVRKLKDITGPVVDVEGNYIITAGDFDMGVFDKEGTPLQGLTGLAGNTLSGLAGVWGAQTRFALRATKAILTAPFAAINAIVDRPKDVYVVGESLPALSATIMKNGGYFSEVSGNPIRKPSDIDGPVRDTAGNIVLTHAQILEGLQDVNGNRIDSNAAVMLAKKTLGLVGGTAKLAWDVTKFGFNLPINAIKGGVNFIRGLRDGRGGGAGDQPTPEDVATMDTNEVLQNMFNFMLLRWPMDMATADLDLQQQQLAFLQEIANPNTGPGDRDGDGDRDNSLSDILSRRNTNQEAPSDERVIREKAEKEGGIMATIIAGIASTLGTIGSYIPGIAAALGGLLAANKAADIVDGIDIGGEGEDGKRRGRKGGRGRKGKLGNFGRKVAETAVEKSAARKATRGAGGALARGVGRKIATKAAIRGGVAAAGAAVAGTVLAPALAVAGTAYTVWEIGSWFVDRMDAEELERLRYLQYGINPDSGDHLGAIRDTEDELVDLVRVSRSGVELRIDNSKIVELFADIWGVDTSVEIERQALVDWFNMRVIPVFTRHCGAAHQIDKKIDLLDIDDEIDEDDVPRFLVGVKTFPGKKPMSFMTPIYPMIPRLASEQEANLYLMGLMAKYNKATTFESDKMEAEQHIKEDVDRQVSAASRPMTTSDAYSAMAQAKLAEAQAQNLPPKKYKRSTGRQQADMVELASRTSGPSDGTFKIIKPCKGRLTSEYGRRQVGSKMEMHKGVDWADYEGSPIVAAADGIIKRHEKSDSYGWCTYIQHSNGWYTRYAHMHELNRELNVGDKVKQGDMIGTMGNTGNSRGVHLHFEVREGYSNDYKTHDPLKFIVNGRKELEEVKAEKDSLRQETKDSMGETAEGLNTIAPQASKSKSESKKTTAEMIPAIVTAEQQTRASASLGQMSGYASKSLDESVKQTKALGELVKGQSRMIELLEGLLEKPTEATVVTPEETAKTQKAAIKPSGNKTATPVINMGRG